MIQQVSTEEQEFCRIHKLSEFDLQYQEMAEEFGQITDLAATIAGTEISFLNLIDNYNQWSISANEFRNIPREDSICSVTIQSEADHMEVNGLHLDERFQSKEYVKRRRFSLLFRCATAAGKWREDRGAMRAGPWRKIDQ